MTPPSTSVEHKKEIEYCSFTQHVFSEEPYHTEFKITSAVISFYIYHNEESPNVLDMLWEFDIDMHALSDNGWRDFTVRSVSPSGTLAQTYGFGLLFESINQNCIDLFVNCDNIDTYMHID